MQREKSRKYKILLLNLGYCSGLSGSAAQYIFASYRYLFSPQKIRRKIIADFKAMIVRENPDIICLAEVRSGQQIRDLMPAGYSFCNIENKYGKRSPLRIFPLFRKNSNAFIARQPLQCKKHFLAHGIKKLVYEIYLPDGYNSFSACPKLFFVHLALGKKIRAKQFKELSRLMRKNTDGRETILCGDFNIFNGNSEIASFIAETGLKLTASSSTFPACNPKCHLDLFLCSKNICACAKTLSDKISDHLPVILEF